MEAVKEKQKMKADMQAMMEAYAKLAVPGPQHELLEKMMGSWISRSKTWMDPDSPPEETVGTSENMMVFGGRFLQQEYKDTMKGEPVAGMSIIGFDNNSKRYVTVSLGSMATSIMFFEGPDSKDGKTITQEASYDEPVAGPMKYRIVMHIIDDDNYRFEMYMMHEGSGEMKMMETMYTRK